MCSDGLKEGGRGGRLSLTPQTGAQDGRSDGRKSQVRRLVVGTNSSRWIVRQSMGAHNSNNNFHFYLMGTDIEKSNLTLCATTWIESRSDRSIDPEHSHVDPQSGACGSDRPKGPRNMYGTMERTEIGTSTPTPHTHTQARGETDREWCTLDPSPRRLATHSVERVGSSLAPEPRKWGRGNGVEGSQKFPRYGQGACKSARIQERHPPTGQCSTTFAVGCTRLLPCRPPIPDRGCLESHRDLWAPTVHNTSHRVGVGWRLLPSHRPPLEWMRHRPMSPDAPSIAARMRSRQLVAPRNALRLSSVGGW